MGFEHISDSRICAPNHCARSVVLEAGFLRAAQADHRFVILLLHQLPERCNNSTSDHHVCKCQNLHCIGLHFGTHSVFILGCLFLSSSTCPSLIHHQFSALMTFIIKHISLVLSGWMHIPYRTHFVPRAQSTPE